MGGIERKESLDIVREGLRRSGFRRKGNWYLLA